MSEAIAERDEEIERMRDRKRVYLCGGVDKSPDLGVGIRLEAAKAIEAAGMVAVWPVGMGTATEPGWIAADARSYWARAVRAWREFRSVARHPIMDDLKTLQTCHGVIVLLDRYAGGGTRAEVEFAKCIGLPTVAALLEKMGDADLTADGWAAWVRVVAAVPPLYSIPAAVAKLKEMLP